MLVLEVNDELTGSVLDGTPSRKACAKKTQDHRHHDEHDRRASRARTRSEHLSPLMSASYPNPPPRSAPQPTPSPSGRYAAKKNNTNVRSNWLGWVFVGIERCVRRY